MKQVDLVISGSVAVNREGVRVGKGGGYADLEYGLATAAGIVTPDIPVITTIHPMQLLAEDLPRTDHDVPLDFAATVDEVIQLSRQPPSPQGNLLGRPGRTEDSGDTAAAEVAGGRREVAGNALVTENV